ncbi:HPP family protein [Rhizobium wenxiniae]|uniref:HPP family protein n=1 Tax=Rhizobium wenxiniae TaxID=1737357 RepID=UPI001C6F031F|nr:HPP family protein [Rhizobium wenxiniae]MBW9090196.1 HPP family protein [Rhizobium wenxiniae]
MRPMLRRLLPDTPPVTGRERLRASTGALLGILITGLIGSLAIGPDPSLPALIAPMGASAVLLFAVPVSPLAQPWSIIGGNTIAALVGVAAAAIVPNPFAAAALAIGISIGLMMTLRCLHPPSGAIALTAVLGGPAIHDLGYAFVIWPVLGNSFALLALALIFNNVTGRRYPHRALPASTDHGTKDPAPIQRIGFSSDDLDEVLKEYDAFLDVDRDDLETILRRTELRSYRRRGGDLSCDSFMSRDVVTASPAMSVLDAQKLMQSHHIKALPVIGQDAKVIGIVTQTDLFDKVNWVGAPSNLVARILLAVSGKAEPRGTVETIMTSPVTTAQPDMPLAEAIIRFAENGLHYLPVITGDNRLVGILSQSDVLIAMLADRDGRP